MNPLDRITLAFIAAGANHLYGKEPRPPHVSIIDVIQNATDQAELLSRSFEPHLRDFEGVFACDVAFEFGMRAAHSYLRDPDNFDEEVERHIKELLSDRNYPPVVVYPSREPTNVQEALDQAIYQRNLLGQSILGTAVELGLVKPNASADGPTLMMLCKDIVDYTKNLESKNGSTAVKKFTIYWLDGRRDVIEGTSIEDAFRKAGYGGGATAAIDWYDNGDTNTHDFIKGQGWVRKT